MQEWNSQLYSKSQAYFLHATCARILDKWDLMNEMYANIQDGADQSANTKVSNPTCSLLLLPLEKSRIEIENTIDNFIELVLFNDKTQYVYPSVKSDLH